MRHGLPPRLMAPQPTGNPNSQKSQATLSAGNHITRLSEAAEASPALRDLLQRYTEALLAQTFQSVACNAVHAVEARCCRWILSTQDRVGQKDLPLTHESLAEMLGVQRSTVSLVVRALQTAGLVRQGRGVISVSDRAGLEESA